MQFHHLVKKRTSVLNEMIDRSGIRNDPYADTPVLTQRLRPLGHPAYVVNFRRASVFVRDLHLASKASQKFVDYCKPLFHGQLGLDNK